MSAVEDGPPYSRRDVALQRLYGPFLVVGLTLLGGLLRFYDIGAKTIWLDEAFSIWTAHHTPAEILDWLVRIDQHPPLYYLLLSGWIRLFGDLQGAARSLSALCSTLTIPLFYLIAQRISHDRWTALLATLILTLSPFHVRFAQETRMYALLTLLAAGAIYGAVCLLQRTDGRRITWRDWLDPRRWRQHPAMAAAFALALCQAGVMWTHNTATVFFPLALNLPVIGVALAQRRSGRLSSMAAINHRGFLADWLQVQAVAVFLWLPWLAPFLRQARGVDEEFWIPPPDLPRIIETFEAFNFAHLPPMAITGPLLLLYLTLAAIGLVSMRRRAAWGWLLASLWLTPIVSELLVSLRRPIFYDRTLIWTTLALFLLLALGIRSLGRLRVSTASAQTTTLPIWAKTIQALLVLLITAVSGMALFGYFRYFEKEEWADAAAYVAANAAPDDLLLFNATWVQLPFEYYFRHEESQADLRGVPSDLFSSGQLEPKMSVADLPRLYDLVDGRKRVWVIYSHDWYTDPEQLIPQALDARMERRTTRPFNGLQVLEYLAANE